MITFVTYIDTKKPPNELSGYLTYMIALICLIIEENRGRFYTW